ncbi:MAG: permease-like cell division protein FtsX [Actinomycetota bacterium]
MRFTFFFREALRSLKRNAMPSFAAMVTVLVTILVLGVFIPIVQATTGAADEIRGKLLIDVYLRTDAKPADIARVRTLLADKTPNVKSVQFVSKEAAYAREKARFPDQYELLGKTNPLPDTFRVTPINPDKISEIRNSLLLVAGGGTVAVDPAIEEVKNRRDQTAKILEATNFIKITMALLASLLALASVLLIANTIRLSLFARRREIEVMKLVGATDSFIRWPFIIEAIIVGGLGALMAISLLAVGKVAILDPFAETFALIAAPETLNFGLLIAILLAAAIGVSAAGSTLSLRRFLRV